MNRNTRKITIIIFIILAIIVLDQVTKIWLISYLKSQMGHYLEITPFLDLVFVWNYGASFGILRNYYQFSNYGFLIINVCITIILIWILIKGKNSYNILAFPFLIGGAVGNIIDRIYHGAVFDFIYFHYYDIGFPAFNIADSAITLGAMIYLYCHIKAALMKD